MSDWRYDRKCVPRRLLVQELIDRVRMNVNRIQPEELADLIGISEKDVRLIAKRLGLYVAGDRERSQLPPRKSVQSERESRVEAMMRLAGRGR